MDEIIKKIKENNIGKLEVNVSLKKYTTYRVGGVARCIVYPRSVTKLVTLIKLLKSSNIKFKILGRGSNLLFSNKLYDGVLIKLKFE